MSSQRLSEPRFDIRSWAYADTGTLSIDFTEAMPGVISHTEEILPGILADYSAAEQLISLDLNLASIHTPCHFHGDNTDSQTVSGKQPVALPWGYNQDSAQLTVFLTSEQRIGLVKQTEDHKVSIGTDPQGHWQAVIIEGAEEFVPLAK